MNRIRRVVGLMLLVGFSALTGMAQINMATLRGTVTDSSGAVVPGAVVRVVEVTTNVLARRAVTDQNGNYEMPDLKPGTYRISVDKAGFRQFVAESVLLDPSQVRRVDAALKVGNSSESVTVSAGAALIETENGTISRQIDAVQYTSAATVDRSPTPLSMLVTTPGMQGNGWNMLMSGISSGAEQTWEMDGIAGDTGSGGGGSDTAQLDNPEFFETIQATTVNAGADASRAVGFNMVSKHGSNGFHGALSWKEGNSALGARQYFAPTNTPFILHNGEAEAGGPILKNRTFFFGGYWFQKVPLGEWYWSNVPTAQMRTGDFSQFLNPATAPNGKVTLIKDPKTGQPFDNNQIPPDRISAVAKAYLNYWPLPNVSDPNTYVHNYGRNELYPAYHANYIFGRIDHELTKNNSLFVRWIGRYNPFPMAAGPSAQFDYTEERDDQQWVASDTWVLTPSMVNNLTYGHTSEHIVFGNSYPGASKPLFGDDVVNQVGLQGVNAGDFHSIGFPSVSIGGVGSVTTLSNTSGCQGGLGGTCSSNKVDTVKDTITWSKGRHVWTFGTEFDHFGQYAGSISSSVYGSFNFNGTYTGSGFSDFLLGIPNSSARLTDPLVGRHLHQLQLGEFVEDSFKVTPRLTVGYGVRWDFYGTPEWDDGLMFNFDPASGDIVVPQGKLAKVSPLFPTNSIPVVEGTVVPSPKRTNFRPRFSAAYRISNKMVLRGGYGEFTESFGYGSSGRVSGAGPFELSQSYYNSISNGTPLFAFPDPFPSSTASSVVPSQSATELPLHTDEGVLRQYNVTLERQVGQFGLRASFVGLNGSGMNYGLNVNKPRASTTPFSVSRRPWPNFNSVTQYRNDGSWHRQALQLEAQKRAGAWTIDSNFSLANNMQNYLDTVDPYDVTSKWSRVGAERRLYLANRLTGELPFGRGRRYLFNAGPLVNAVVGGWNAQAIITLASGAYTSPSYTGPDPANASPGNVTQLPDCVGDPYAGSHSINQWWNPAAFAAPPANAGRYGNCHMNILKTYPIRNAGMSVSKTWNLTERIHAMFAVQAADITNTPTFANVDTNITQAKFGAFTSVYAYNQPEGDGYRQMDARLRITW